MQESVIIKPPIGAGSTRLTLYVAERDSAGEVGHFTVKIEDDRLTAEARIHAFMADAFLVQPFYEMAVQWKGWQGTIEARTIDNDFRLVCTADKTGHAFVEVFLRPVPIKSDWSVTTTLGLESGQYQEIADQLRRFFQTEVSRV